MSGLTLERVVARVWSSKRMRLVAASCERTQWSSAKSRTSQLRRWKREQPKLSVDGSFSSMEALELLACSAWSLSRCWQFSQTWRLQLPLLKHSISRGRASRSAGTRRMRMSSRLRAVHRQPSCFVCSLELPQPTSARPVARSHSRPVLSRKSSFQLTFEFMRVKERHRIPWV